MLPISCGVEGDAADLHPDLRDEVYRIAGEATCEAFGTQCEADRSGDPYDERQFRLRVRDDGRGIDSKLLNDDERPATLRHSRDARARQALGGKMTVWSEPIQGTEWS